MKLIAEVVVGGTSTVTVSNIPTELEFLKVMFEGRSTGPTAVGFQINGVSTVSGGQMAYSQGGALTGTSMSSIDIRAASANQFDSRFNILIGNTGPRFPFLVENYVAPQVGSSSPQWISNGCYSSNSNVTKVTSITLTNLGSGSTLYIYGW